MQTAYQYLFDIENTLRDIAKQRLFEAYGPNWQRSAAVINKRILKDFDSLYFHDLISWFRIYPPLQDIFPSSFHSELTLLIPIRNKIAHCHMLTEEEFEQLQKAHIVLNKAYEFVQTMNRR